MLRRIFTPLAFLSLLLCIGVGVLRVKYQAREEFAYHFIGRYALSLMSTKAGVRWMVVSYREPGSSQGRSLFSPGEDDVDYWTDFMGPLLEDDPIMNDCDDGKPSALGFKAGAKSGDFQAFSGWESIGQLGRLPTRRASPDYHYVFLVTPYWSLIVVTAILPALRILTWLKKRKQRATGACRVCGYDLRATPQRCPECGTGQKCENPPYPRRKFAHLPV